MKTIKLTETIGSKLAAVSISFILLSNTNAAINFSDSGEILAGAGQTFTANSNSASTLQSFNLNAQAGVSFDMQASVPGTWSAFGYGINFSPANPLLSGESVSFTAVANMVLSGDLNARASASFRAWGASNPDIDGTVDITVGGGNDTLLNYYNAGGETPLAVGDESYNGSLANIGGNGEVSAIPTAGDANTISFTEGAPTQGDLNVEVFGDFGNNPNGFSFQEVAYTFTNNGDTLAAGDSTLYRFTFDGTSPVGQTSLIPEPTGVTLLTLGGVLLGFRRKRS